MKKISVFFYLLTAIMGSVATLFFYNITAKSKQSIPKGELSYSSTNSDCEYRLERLSGYKYIHPLMYITKECESNKFLSLKTNIISYLDAEKATDPKSKVTVYLNDLTDDWMSINPDEMYLPGSLIKVVLLITHLKSAEANPSILDKKITYKTTNKFIPPHQHYNSKSILPGHTYTVRELLKYMVAYSDNYATMLLNDYVDKNLLQQTFTDFGFGKINFRDFYYKISAKDYSLFMRALYNAGYLNISSSEFALSLLVDSDFKDGILKGVPKDVMVAHKFGEAGVPGEHQLHESGIIFLNDRPYLLTIMTKGQDVVKQAEIMSNISNMVYTFMAGQKS